MTPSRIYLPSKSRRQQQGVTTLAITLMLLVILGLIVLFSTNVGFFEQRTTNNETRARLAEQAAEMAVGMAGEFMKANRIRLISDRASVQGWLATGGTRRWARCSDVTPLPSGHPCAAERDSTRRAELYFYSATGSATANSSEQLVPYTSVLPNDAKLESAGIGGDSNFGVNTEVRALLCRVDSSLSTPACKANPLEGNRVAITLIGSATLPGEGATATVKEIWGSISNTNPQAAVPLVASGVVDGTGNVEIVTSPNGAGWGLPVSVWSPQNVDIDKSSGGSAASISTCHLGEFLKLVPEAELKTTCATSNNACGCPAPGENNFLSGKVPGASPACCENIDILDRDSGVGTNPDITFFPGEGLDKSTDATDDSLFEWIFGVDYEMAEAGIKGPSGGAINQTTMDCGAGGPGTGTGNCAVHALVEDFSAQSVTCAQLSSLGASATGIYYVNDSSAGSPCSLPGQIGTPESPAVVVLNDDSRLNSTIFYGLLFVRSNDNTAVMTANGNAKVFGAVVVEGSVNITGTLTIVYDNTSATGNPNVLPANTKFGRVSGSWLDASSGF